MCDPRREMLKQTLRSLLEQTIDDRVDRYLSVNHQSIIGSHHFAPASTECISAYRDGNFTLCVMGTQAVNDGIIKFVAERNEVPRLPNESNQELAERLRLSGMVSQDFVDAASRIQRSFRNDFHHMNPPIAKVNAEEIANRNILDLAIIEREIFGCDFGPNGTLIAKQRRYWDISNKDDTVPAYIRMV